MMAHDRGELLVAQDRDHPRAVDRVALDDLELFVGQPLGLVEDLYGSVDLAHVVNRCGRANPGNLT